MTPNANIISAMLIAIFSFLTLVLLLGCGTTGHVSIMHEVGNDSDTVGQNPLCTLEVRKSVTGRITGKYFHQSWCSSGVPFNKNPESTADAVGVEFKIW